MGKSVLVIVAHPDLPVSRANKALAQAASGVDGVTVHDLYATYPDMFIDGKAERERLETADAIVLQHPIYWYSGPGLLKEWIDRTLTAGWAYGRGGHALKDKVLMSSITTGSAARAYAPNGPHGHPIEDYLKPFSQVAAFCGMQWAKPLILHHSRTVSAEAINAHADQLLERLQQLTGQESTEESDNGR